MIDRFLGVILGDVLQKLPKVLQKVAQFRFAGLSGGLRKKKKNRLQKLGWVVGLCKTCTVDTRLTRQKRPKCKVDIYDAKLCADHDGIKIS